MANEEESRMLERTEMLLVRFIYLFIDQILAQ